MTYNELMIQSLLALLEDDETLKFPIYGTLLQNKMQWYGFFGLTDDYLLIALLEGDSKIVSWTTRIPLNIKTVKMKKIRLPFQHILTIEFHQGLPCIMCVSRKVLGIKSQEENLSGFVQYIQERQNSNL